MATEIDEGIREALRLQESVLLGLLGDAVYGKFVAVKGTWAAGAGARSSNSSFIDWLLAFTDNNVAVEVNRTDVQNDRQQHVEEVQMPQNCIKHPCHQQQTRPTSWAVIKTEPCVDENDVVLSDITQINSCDEIPIPTDVQSDNGPCQANSTVSPSPPIPSTTSPSPRSAPTLPTASSLPACRGLTFYRCTVCDYCVPQKPAILRHMAHAHSDTRGKGCQGRARKYNIHELAAQPDIAIVDVTLNDLPKFQVNGNQAEQSAVEEGSDTHSMQDGNVQSTVITADSEDDIAVELVLDTMLDTAPAVTQPPTAAYVKLEAREPWPQMSSNGPEVSSNGPEGSSNRPEVSSNRPGVSSSGPGLSSNRPELSSNIPGVSHTEPGVSRQGPELIPKLLKKKLKESKKYPLKRYSCRYCSFTTKHAPSRRRHEVQKHRQMLEKTETLNKHKTAVKAVKYGKAEKKPFECSICGRQFILAGRLRNHQQMSHGVAKFGATSSLNHSGVQTEQDNMEGARMSTRSKKSDVKGQKLVGKRVKIHGSKNIKVEAFDEVGSPSVRLQDVSLGVSGHSQETVEGQPATCSEVNSAISPSPPNPSTTSTSHRRGLTFYRCTACDYCRPQKSIVLRHMAHHGHSRHADTPRHKPGGKGSIRGRARKYCVHELAGKPDVRIVDVTLNDLPRLGVKEIENHLEQPAVEEGSGNMESMVNTVDSEDDIAVEVEMEGEPAGNNEVDGYTVGHHEEVEGTGITFTCPHCPGRQFARLHGLHIHQGTYHKGGKRMGKSSAAAVAVSDVVGCVMQDMSAAIAADNNEM